MNYHDRTVSRSFREALAEELPALAGNITYWRMTAHLLFGNLRDIDTEQLALPSPLIAAIEGKKFDSHYVAYHFLNAYRKEVLDFVIDNNRFSTHEPGTGRVRTVASLALPERINDLVSAERMNRDADRVWMSTGNKYLRKHTAAQRKADREKAQAEADKVGGQTRLLLDYLNALPPHRFTNALKHLPEAMEAAKKLHDADNQLNLLAEIRDHAQPFYKSVDKTTRVFSLRESVLRLHRDLRKIMTQDWITADLRSAQLAIVATVWEIPSLTEYLFSGQSIWPDLCKHMGLKYTPDHKAVMKTALYALIFGAGNKRMIVHLEKHFADGAEAFRLLKKHPVIRGLLLARSKQLRKIRKDGGGMDAFGTWTDLERYDVEGYEYQYDNSRSILACIAQSYELRLLLPIIQLAVEEQFNSHGFTITTWLHDGFTFDVHDAADRQSWINRLSLAVQANAEAMDICTRLDFE